MIGKHWDIRKIKILVRICLKIHETLSSPISTLPVADAWLGRFSRCSHLCWSLGGDAAMVKCEDFLLSTSKTSSQPASLTFQKDVEWFSFLFMCYSLWVFSICPKPHRSRSRSNTKALSAVKFFMISRKIFQFWPHLA